MDGLHLCLLVNMDTITLSNASRYRSLVILQNETFLVIFKHCEMGNLFFGPLSYKSPFELV